MGQSRASEARRSHGGPAMRSPAARCTMSIECPGRPDIPVQVAMHCAAAMPSIGHPGSPVGGSGVAEPAQSGQAETACIAASPSPHDAGDTAAPAIGAWSTIRKASR